MYKCLSRFISNSEFLGQNVLLWLNDNKLLANVYLEMCSI